MTFTHHRPIIIFLSSVHFTLSCVKYHWIHPITICIKPHLLSIPCTLQWFQQRCLLNQLKHMSCFVILPSISLRTGTAFHYIIYKTTTVMPEAMKRKLAFNTNNHQNISWLVCSVCTMTENYTFWELRGIAEVEHDWLIYASQLVEAFFLCTCIFFCVFYLLHCCMCVCHYFVSQASLYIKIFQDCISSSVIQEQNMHNDSTASLWKSDPEQSCHTHARMHTQA